jgi:hypothetical protein
MEVEMEANVVDGGFVFCGESGEGAKGGDGGDGEMAEAGTLVMMLTAVEMVVMTETLGQVRVEMAGKEETPMVDLRAQL